MSDGLVIAGSARGDFVCGGDSDCLASLGHAFGVLFVPAFWIRHCSTFAAKSRLAALFPVACCNVVPLPIWLWLLPSLPRMSAADLIRLHMHTYAHISFLWFMRSGARWGPFIGDSSCVRPHTKPAS